VLGVVLSKHMGMGLTGVWAAMYVDWIVRGFCFLLRYRSGKWMTKAITRGK
jgi:Na+-driven multidrug efflux pump